jgi:hypothetical protein
MLFSENMCFFKRPKPVPAPILEISGPVPKYHDYETAPQPAKPFVPPYERSYSVHTVNLSAPAPPPKIYHTKQSLTPSMPQPEQPVWNSKWSFAGSRVNSIDYGKASAKHTPKERKHSLWTHHHNGEKRTIFKNAGLDEKGRLKLDYQELDDTDWGEPDDYVPFERRPSAWRAPNEW